MRFGDFLSVRSARGINLVIFFPNYLLSVCPALYTYKYIYTYIYTIYIYIYTYIYIY